MLGFLLKGHEDRDAIHIAIAPVVAGETIRPGAGIGFLGDDREFVWNKKDALGIADPYLPSPIQRGDRFYMCMFPNTITSLKHVWEHPAFQVPMPVPVQSSEDWMRQYASSIGVEYETLMAKANAYVSTGRRWFEGSRFEGMFLPEAFWSHFEALTGVKASKEDKERNFFSCSC